MIYIITTKIGDKKKTEVQRFYDKAQALYYYKLKLREMTFPDTIDVGVLNDGE